MLSAAMGRHDNQIGAGCIFFSTFLSFSISSMAHSPATPVAPGRPARWHRRVLALAFPIVLANLTQPLLSA
ncbi:hypothetical protein, partial [Ralstonia solanacearum]|uniref:hypothetical protein n=1 Tax=Ralstonia solanacearum TaxID=305 RepID=UPI0012D3E56C